MLYSNLETIINFNTSSLLSESILQRLYNISVFPYQKAKRISQAVVNVKPNLALHVKFYIQLHSLYRKYT